MYWMPSCLQLYWKEVFKERMIMMKYRVSFLMSRNRGSFFIGRWQATISCDENMVLY